MAYPRSYYADSIGEQERKRFLPLEQDLTVETCIIGGGYAGLSTALGLVERGHKDVVLIDAQDIGFGCSGRNGGFVFGGFSLGERDLLRSVGPEKGAALYQVTLDGIELIRERIKKYKIDCDAVWDGVLLCNWFDDDKLLQDHRDFMAKSFGVELDHIPTNKLRETVKSNRYFGALREKNAFHFHPLKYALGLAEAAKSQGARIHANTPALRVMTDDPVKVVHTPRGRIRAERVVIACGGYVDGLYRPLTRASLPVATYVMVTEPLGARRDEAFACSQAIYDTRFAFDYYRPLPDGRILWGGRISTNLNQPKNLDKLLQQDLLRVYPQLKGVKVDCAWQGYMSYARHKMPQIGMRSPGVWYAQAFGGHGVSPTNAAGDMLAAAIAEGDSRYKMLSEKFGLSSTLGLLGKVGAEATYKWYQLKDSLRS